MIQNIIFCVQQKTESHTGLERHEGVYVNLFLGDLFKDNLFSINSHLSLILHLLVFLSRFSHSRAPWHKDPPCKSPNPVTAV